MNLENQVCSLELAKKLLTLGIKQDSIFKWCDTSGFYHANKSKLPSILVTIDPIGEVLCSAFTVAELGEMLPPLILNNSAIINFFKEEKDHILVCPWIIQYIEIGTYKIVMRNKNHLHFDDYNEANARAKMLIYLIENNLMDISK